MTIFAMTIILIIIIIEKEMQSLKSSISVSTIQKVLIYKVFL